VVVDDASTDATAAVAERAGARVVRLERRSGPALARNAGLAATTAPLVAFTDADCEPAPGWLSALVAALGDADLVTGPVLPAGPAGPFDRTLRIEGPSPLFESANLGVSRAIAGAFATPPGGPDVEAGHFGEDAVFSWRAVRAGARVAYAPGAVVHHAVFPRGARGYVAERARLRHFPGLVREVPELRGRLPARVFLSPRTARFDLAIAGLAAAAVSRRRWPLALAVPYARRFLRADVWHRGALREDAAHLAADAVGLAALVRGSLAARTLLL
jgi:glycosyltransferase involved in cell wall biosynthesis